MKQQSLGYQSAAIIALGGFVFGFDAAVISGLIDDVKTLFGLTDIEKGWVVSIPTLFSVLGFLTVTPLAESYGRKRVLWVLALLYCISAALSALSWNYTSLLVARAIGGYAFGALALAPIYIAELAPARDRGRFVSFNQLMIVIGLSAAYFSNLGISALLGAGGETAHPYAWKVMLGTELLPALAWLLLLSLVPESPRWLMLQGRGQEANAILDTSFSVEQAAEMRQEFKSAPTSEPKISMVERFGLLLDGRLRFVLGLGLLIAIIQQITGINAVFFYAPSIFEESGLSRNAALLQATYVGVINVVVTVVALATIDRLGRRPLIVIGLVGIALSLSLSAYGFASSSNGLVLAGILGFVASFGVSLGPGMWVLLSEIFPARVRGTAIAIAAVFNGATSWIVQLLFPKLASSYGVTSVFMGFASFAVIGLVLVLIMLPETKNKSLEELERELTGAG